MKLDPQKTSAKTAEKQKEDACEKAKSQGCHWQEFCNKNPWYYGCRDYDA